MNLIHQPHRDKQSLDTKHAQRLCRRCRWESDNHNRRVRSARVLELTRQSVRLMRHDESSWLSVRRARRDAPNPSWGRERLSSPPPDTFGIRRRRQHSRCTTTARRERAPLSASSEAAASAAPAFVVCRHARRTSIATSSSCGSHNSSFSPSALVESSTVRAAPARLLP